MPQLQNIKIEGLGQYGYNPDAAPSQLSPGAFSYVRNFRFNEGNFCETTAGYTEAFAGLINNTALGGTNTDATFFYSWNPDGTRPRVIYYDDNARVLNELSVNTTTRVLEETQLTTASVQHPTGSSFTWQATDAFGVPILNNGLESPYVYVNNRTLPAIGAISRSGGANANRVQFTFAADTGLNVGDIFTVTGAAPDIYNREYTVVTVVNGRIITTSQSSTGFAAETALGTALGNSSIRDLDNFPTTARTPYITKYNAFLIAVGYNDPTAADAGERGSNRTLAISDVITTPGTLPTWDFSNLDSFAQIFDLSLYTAGDILHAEEQNGSLYVSTTTNIIILTYQGEGNFAATVLPFPNGVLSSKSVTAIPNGFFVIGNRRMYIHDGSSATPIGDGQFVETWFGTVDEDRLNEVQAIYDPLTTSVWIKTPLTGNAQEIWIYNLSNNTVTALDDHQEIRYITFAPNGVPNIPVIWDNFGTAATWDGLTQNQWNEFPTVSTELFRNRILSVGGRNIFVHDVGFTFNGRAINAVLRRTDLPLQTNNSYSSFQWQRVIPWIASPQSGSMVSCRVGGSFSLNGDIGYTGFNVFSVDNDQKLDFRRTSKWAAIEFTTQDPVEISGFELEVTTGGKR